MWTAYGPMWRTAPDVRASLPFLQPSWGCRLRALGRRQAGAPRPGGRLDRGQRVAEDNGARPPDRFTRGRPAECLIPTARIVDSNVNRRGSTRCDSPSALEGTAMTVAITRSDLSAADLREAAARTPDAKAARRMLAIALFPQHTGGQCPLRQTQWYPVQRQCPGTPMPGRRAFFPPARRCNMRKHRERGVRCRLPDAACSRQL
jgi:hypothetical protein